MSLHTTSQESAFTIIGAMSGTSMDGLDLALCVYTSDSLDDYSFKVKATATYSYPEDLLEKLRHSKSLSAEAIFELDKRLGQFFGDRINEFVDDLGFNRSRIDAVASHGHTVFHQPEKGFTVQIGCGDTIARKTGFKVINDFRQKDVIAGGQGAPLVPIGDLLLFGKNADAFLNIGGFTNITIPGSPTIAFDICPGNLPLNQIAEHFGKKYDQHGEIARKGKVDQKTLNELDNLSFYNRNAPKSLGTEWLEHDFLPILEKTEDLQDRMTTCAVHIAGQIRKTCLQFGIQSLYVTGGGAFNRFLIEKMGREKDISLIIPSDEIINFKEAIIFGFLGLRYLEGKTNTISSVTGASEDVIGGALHLP